jgi:hypothetical protein
MSHPVRAFDPAANLAAIRAACRLLHAQIEATQVYIAQVIEENLEQIAQSRRFCDELRRQRHPSQR